MPQQQCYIFLVAGYGSGGLIPRLNSTAAEKAVPQNATIHAMKVVCFISNIILSTQTFKSIVWRYNRFTSGVLWSIGGATGVPKGSGNTQFHSWNTQKKNCRNLATDCKRKLRECDIVCLKICHDETEFSSKLF